MDGQVSYVDLTRVEALTVYLALFAIALLTGWVYFYKFGQVLLKTLFPTTEPYDLEWPLAIFAGLWAFPTLVLFGGLLGTFSVAFLLFYAAVILAGCRYQRVALLPRLPLGEWLRQDAFAVGSCLSASLLLAVIGVGHLTPWFDGNFPTAGGHLARTGFYVVSQSDGQPGMVTLVALVNVFLPVMSPLTAAVGWGALYAPFLFFGVYFLLRELFGKGRWEPLAVLVFLFPVGFKIHEIRASIAGFILLTWTLLFILRVFRTGRRLDLVGAVVTLSAAWNFGQIGALYFFALLGLWSVAKYLGGHTRHALTLWIILLWTNLIEWLHLVVSFQWAMGKDAPLWTTAAPGTLTLLLAAAVVYVLPRLPTISLSRRWLLVPFVGAAVLAYYENPVQNPAYNFVFFLRKTDFLFFNFESYGLLGWLFPVALLLALEEIVRRKDARAAQAIWLGFFLSCLVQWISARLVRAGTFPVGEPAAPWDLWKDTTLYWINVYMVLAMAYLGEQLTGLSAYVRNAVTPARLKVAVVVAMLLCIQSLEPYRVLAQDRSPWNQKLHAVMTAHLAEHVDIKWMGQQLYSFPSYLFYAFNNDGVAKQPAQRPDCRVCSVWSLAFMRAQWPIFDVLAGAPLAPRDTFVTSDSINTYEMFVNRQVRYASGANTVSPLYIAYLDLMTKYQWYWKPGNRIRRTSVGMAYAIVNPQENLTWLTPALQSDGTLLATFSVRRGGDYEIYRGDDSAPGPARARIEGLGLTIDPVSPALGWTALESDRPYTVRFSPIPPDVALTPDVPIVVYPRRYWDYEKVVLQGEEPIIGALGVMRSTGVPDAGIAIEDMRTLMTDAEGSRRHEVLRRYQIRFIILDWALRKVFPGAEALLDRDPLLRRQTVDGIPLFTYVG